MIRPGIKNFDLDRSIIWAKHFLWKYCITKIWRHWIFYNVWTVSKSSCFHLSYDSIVVLDVLSNSRTCCSAHKILLQSFSSCIILRRIVHTLTLQTIGQEIYSHLKKKAVRNQVDSQPISTLHRIEPCFKVSTIFKQGVQNAIDFFATLM